MRASFQEMPASFQEMQEIMANQCDRDRRDIETVRLPSQYRAKRDMLANDPVASGRLAWISQT
jgi:hypothetical protein